VALLASRGVVGHPAQATGALALAEVGVPDLLAWTSDLTLPVRAVLAVDGPAVPLLRLGERRPVVAAGARGEDGAALLALGVEPLVSSPEVLLNAVCWAAPLAAAGAAPRDPLVDNPAWQRLKADVSELQRLQ